MKTPENSVHHGYFNRMLKLTSSVKLLLSCLVLTACSNKVATFVPAPADVEKGSIVYVYRPGNSANFMMSPRVVLDENQKFQIDSGKYRYLYVQAGNHSIVLNPTKQYETARPVNLQVEPGKSYYLRVKTSLKFNLEGMNDRLFWIEQVSEEQALPQIADTDYAGPKHTESKGVNTIDSATDGFSIDKTRDPFAGKN